MTRPPATHTWGQTTRWTGFLAHLTETCSSEGSNVITDVATTAATTSDAQALPGIHTRLKRRGLLPRASASPARSAASAPLLVTAPGMWAFPRENFATCKSASGPSSSRPTGRPGMRSVPEWKPP
jgi:hypothetical protein